jgi:hypothetical protein
VDDPRVAWGSERGYSEGTEGRSGLSGRSRYSWGNDNIKMDLINCVVNVCCRPGYDVNAGFNKLCDKEKVRYSPLNSENVCGPSYKQKLSRV